MMEIQSRQPAPLPVCEESIQRHKVIIDHGLFLRVWSWLHTYEGLLVGISVLGHTLVHLLILLFMPLAYFSELSGHDGVAYYAMAFEPFPAEPTFALMRYKRLGFVLLARVAWPWDVHVGLAIVGIVGAALANLYFYRIIALYTVSPLRLTLLFACSPYLFAAAHVAVPDPISVALTLGAFYYLLKERFIGLTVCSAAALLFKEVAVVSILALAVISVRRLGWRRTMLYLVLTGLPAVVVVLIYMVIWADPLWYFRESRTTLMPAPITLVGLLTDRASPFMVRWSSLVNMGILALLGYALWRLRRFDRTLLTFLIISMLPLLFLDERQYQSDFDMVRQYMAGAPALLAFSGAILRLRRWKFRLLLAGMLCYAMFYILSIGKFFVTYKEEILRLLWLK